MKMKYFIFYDSSLCDIMKTMQYFKSNDVYSRAWMRSHLVSITHARSHVRIVREHSHSGNNHSNTRNPLLAFSLSSPCSATENRLLSVFVHNKYTAYSRMSIQSQSGRSTHSVKSRIVNMRLTLIAALLLAVKAEDGSVQMDGAPDPHIDWVHIATCRSHCFHNVRVYQVSFQI